MNCSDGKNLNITSSSSSSSSSSSTPPRCLESHLSLENAKPLVSRLVKSSSPPRVPIRQEFSGNRRLTTAAFQASGMKGDYPWLAHDATQRTSPATAKICLPNGGGGHSALQWVEREIWPSSYGASDSLTALREVRLPPS